MAPTFDRSDPFRKDQEKLTKAQLDQAQIAVRKFVADLQSGKGFRPSLRVKGVAGTDGVYEMTWAKDGRATFQYGPEVKPGEPHVIWRRIGTHDVFKNP